jgi:hypothetical protein
MFSSVESTVPQIHICTEARGGRRRTSKMFEKMIDLKKSSSIMKARELDNQSSSYSSLFY